MGGYPDASYLLKFHLFNKLDTPVSHFKSEDALKISATPGEIALIIDRSTIVITTKESPAKC